MRALTDSGTLAAPLGVGLGLVYAGTWIALADRAGKAGASWSAGFHGATAAMIGFPLLFEATFRFKLLSPAAASALLAALTAVALAVAARRRMEGLAWLVSLAGAATAGAVVVLTLVAVLLFSATFKDGRVPELTVRVPSGAYAGIAVDHALFALVIIGKDRTAQLVDHWTELKHGPASREQVPVEALADPPLLADLVTVPEERLPAKQDRRPARGRHRDSPVPMVIPITECHLPEPAINNLWPQLHFDAGMNIQRVSIRQGNDAELMLLLESDSPELPELETEAGISVAHIYEEDAAVLAGADHIIMQVLGRDFRVSAASFFQVNTVMAAKMVEHILAGITSLRAAGSRSDLILDVYCGVGLFSAFLAPLCKRLIGIESSPSACEDFAVNLEQFDNIELYEDAAENVLPALDVQPDIILVDPPRAGLQPAALDAIVQMQPQTIIYVSCDPSTLARDAARLLNGGYHLRSVTPFDLFPQTYHIESITWFSL